LDLKPVIMVRPIQDMLASYLDMLEGDSVSPDNWLNIRVPPSYSGFSQSRKADFIIDMMGPWYASYYSTWLDYAAEDPERVCILNYDHFRADPPSALGKLLEHSRLPRSREACEVAVSEIWKDRCQFRFNK